MSAVISVRVPKWVKEKLEEYGVDIPSVVRRSLLEEVRRIEEERLKEDLEFLRVRLRDRIGPRELARMIDGERGER